MSIQHLLYTLSSNLHNNPVRQAGSLCILTNEENKTHTLICPSFIASKRQSWDLNPTLSESKAHVFSTIVCYILGNSWIKSLYFEDQDENKTFFASKNHPTKY